MNNGFRYQLFFYSIPGCSIPELLELDSYIPYIQEVRPDVILLIIGGNDITKRIHHSDLGVTFDKLCYKLTRLPGFKLILGADVEHRYDPKVSQKVWTTKRNALNRSIKKAKYTDGFIQVVGPNRLSQPDFFKPDGVHLNETGLTRYLELIGRSLRFTVYKNQDKIAQILYQNYNYSWDPKRCPLPDYENIGRGSRGVELSFQERSVNEHIPRLIIKKIHFVPPRYTPGKHRGKRVYKYHTQKSAYYRRRY